MPGKTRKFKPARADRHVLLHHGETMLLNIERVAHRVCVGTSCADPEAAQLLPGRRICVSVHPVLTPSSLNASDYRFDKA